MFFLKSNKLVVGLTKAFLKGKAISMEGHTHESNDNISGIELLWTNSDTSVNFNSQTVTITNASQYKLVVVTAIGYIGNGTIISAVISYGHSINIYDGPVGAFRGASFNSSGVYFGNARRTNNTIAANNYTIPIEIFGMR